MINFNNNLILVKGEDKTSSILKWEFDNKNIINITYNNNKEYSYRCSDVKFFKNPKVIKLRSQIVLNNEIPMTGAIELQFFDNYCRVIYFSAFSEIVPSSLVRIVNSAFQSPKSNNCFEYLKQVAKSTGITVNGSNILANKYEKINFVREDSVLATYLSGEYKKEGQKKNFPIVYPFGFNLSQKKAVENALCNQMSIIEGPPGTGKTQTILNIIANAVMRNESVAVVSSNNSATTNVYEKLKKYGVEFIAAPLGNSGNKEFFIETQNPKLPDLSMWKEASDDLNFIRKEEAELDKKLVIQKRLSDFNAEYDALKKEYAHYYKYYVTLEIDKNMPKFVKQISSAKILDFIAEYEMIISQKKRLGFFKKFKFKRLYGLKNLRFYGSAIDMVTPYCQNLYYKYRLMEIKTKKEALDKELSNYDFDKKMECYSDLSMKVFKASLFKKYESVTTRNTYSIDDLWKQSERFINDYPVVLSTAYSLRSSLSNSLVYDYVIIDESSQVDLATGALALSCAKKAVIVGDLKQLPNVVNNKLKEQTDLIFNQYQLCESYRYSSNSFLSSVKSLFVEVPHVLLKEHYRCHPEIIGFCNQRFYNNELIILTKTQSDRKPLMVYRTVPGNHARNHMNQRQIEVIVDEVFPNENLNANKIDESIGIVTPYRNQAVELQKIFDGTMVKADTVDKFQGLEKNVMIFSTVDNQIGEFAANPNRLNVAVSRAINQLIVVTDGNDNDTTSPIHELIGYIKYHNYEVLNSEIRSVFDYLYSYYAKARKEILLKYGRKSDVDSENLMYSAIRDILNMSQYSRYNVVMHVPLREILVDMKKLNMRELEFAKNPLTHGDFLIFSRLTHQPVLVVEVDGYVFHNNEKQQERDKLKDTILQKYDIPILRFSTIGSREKEKLIKTLDKIVL